MTTIPNDFSTPGKHVARLFSIVHIGTVFIHTKFQRQIRLTWEMPYESRDYTNGKGLVPKQISKNYAFSFYGQSWFKKHLTSWLGEETALQLEKKFNPWLMLSQPCEIKIERRQNPNTLTWFEEITDITPYREELTPPQINENRLLTFEDFDTELFSRLPEFVMDQIRSSKEYQHMAHRNPLA